jgi:peptidoglycan/xylan/chitin deacetylase (PgdA/CDA1 family)
MHDGADTVANIRTDRIATLYFFRPLHRLTSGSGDRRIPILMYHSIAKTQGANRHPYFDTETSVRTFEAHMKYLHDNKYDVISPEDVITLLSTGQVEARKCVVITFDDGYRDFYIHAFPILHKYGMSATVYLPSAYIQHQPQPFKGKACMTWSEVRELHKAGIRFGSHTVTHPQLKVLTDRDLEKELCFSKTAIEDELGAPVRSFAYPYAFPEQDCDFIRRLRNLLGEAGYENGVSTVIGSVHTVEDKYFLKRLPTNSWDDISLFRAKLDGDYDWLRGPQYIKKWMGQHLGRQIGLAFH